MKRSLELILCLCVLCAAALAQFETGAVLGTVKDRSDAVIADAEVTLSNLDTNISVRRQTDENGNYEFVNVKPGRYKITAEKTGFSPAAADGVVVSVNARQRVDLQLAVGQVTESVEITASVPLVESESSQRGQVVEQKKIVELPLNGRNYADLALLSAGIRRSSYAVANPPREASFNVNGQRSTFNNFLLDGVDNNAYGTSNQGFSSQVVNLPPDAIAEFRIVTNNMSAEYGRTSGAMVNAAMRSGGNSIHGAAWEFLRNDKLNAVGFFKPRNNVKPTLRRNQFGFVLGGPVIRDKAFFFTDYEGFRERTSFLTTATLPTAAQRQGIFPVEIRNPLTGRVYPATSGIPRADFTNLARFMLDTLPLPNSLVNVNLFENLRKDRNNTDKMDAKIDAQVSRRVSAFIRASHRKTNLFQAPDIPTLAGGGGNGFIRILNQQLAFGATWTLTSASVLEMRMGLSKTRAGKEPPYIGGASMKELFGIPGLSEDRRLTGGITAQEVTGFTAFGRQATNPQWQHPFLYNPRLNYSLILGKHSLKAGYEFQRIHTEIQDVNPLYGQDSYQGSFSGNPLADFIFGLRSRMALTNFFIAQYRQYGHMGYVQDDLRITGKLTLNLGMRYEYFTPQWENENRLSNYDPLTNRLVPATSGSIAGRAQVNPDRNNWAPRIGFAYSVYPRTAIRGGYGIGYIHFNRSGGGNILAINGPQVVTAVVTSRPGDAGYLTTEQGYPSGLTDPDKFNPLLANISYMPREIRTGYVQNWFFSIQREFLRGMVFDIAYVGNRSNKLIMFADFNQARPQRPGENTPLQQRRPIPGFAAITITSPSGWANYHALQFKLERRYAAGLSFLNSFTWSKALDNVGQALEDQGNGNASSPQNFYDLGAEKGPSGYDQRLNNTTAIVWEVPIGKGRKFGGNFPAIADAALGGWQISAINTLTAGEPINLRYAPAASAQVSDIGPDWRGAISYRPDVSGDPKVPENERGPNRYLNAATVIIPIDPSRPFGNAGRNAVYGPSFLQLDMNVQKNFRIAEKTAIQFRSEFFNLLNRTNFRSPNPNRSQPTFGVITQTYPARQIQLALKVIF
jgi:hypothetical protein